MVRDTYFCIWSRGASSTAEGTGISVSYSAYSISISSITSSLITMFYGLWGQSVSLQSLDIFLQLELEIFQSSDTNIDLEDGACVWLGLVMIIRGCDPELRSDENGTCNALRWISDFSYDLSLRRDLQDSAFTIDRLPDISFCIHFEPIRVPVAIMLPENSLIADVSSGAIEVKCDDAFLG